MLDPILEDTVPGRIRRKVERVPSRFERWAWSPIIAFRIGLTAGYITTVYFGISAFFAGIPAFEFTAPEGWTPIWAAILILGGIVASFGSVADGPRFRRAELGGAVALFLTLGVYSAVLLILAYGVGDISRAAVGAGFVALAVPPGVRMLWLMSQLGRK